MWQRLRTIWCGILRFYGVDRSAEPQRSDVSDAEARECAWQAVQNLIDASDHRFRGSFSLPPIEGELLERARDTAYRRRQYDYLETLDRRRGVLLVAVAATLAVAVLVVVVLVSNRQGGP